MDESRTNQRLITLGDAIREGLHEAIARDPRVFLFAQGVDDPSAMWGTMKGVVQRFGRDRVMEMPTTRPPCGAR
jgi:pyruvate dehydrogenase E1 component beta subunit